MLYAHKCIGIICTIIYIPPVRNKPPEEEKEVKEESGSRQKVLVIRHGRGRPGEELNERLHHKRDISPLQGIPINTIYYNKIYYILYAYTAR